MKNFKQKYLGSYLKVVNKVISLPSNFIEYFVKYLGL